MSEDDYEETPCCSKCGAEITTGLMALWCPHGKACEFYPEAQEMQEFLAELRETVVDPANAKIP